MTPEQIGAAQELAAGYINVASACEADTNTLFNSFSMAIAASLISYMENSGISVTEENMQSQIQKFNEQTGTVSNFYVRQYLNLKEKK